MSKAFTAKKWFSIDCRDTLRFPIDWKDIGLLESDLKELGIKYLSDSDYIQAQRGQTTMYENENGRLHLYDSNNESYWRDR